MTTETYRAALEAIAAMDPQAQRADDLGRAARIASSALASAPAQQVATAAERSMPQLSTNDVLHLLNLQVAELLRLFKSIPSNAPLSAKPDTQAQAEPVAPAGHDPVVWTPGDEARLDAALAERTKRREAKAQASRAAESLMDLVGQYWDLAHEEGRTGQSRGTEAGRVLGELQAMAVALAGAAHAPLNTEAAPKHYVWTEAEKAKLRTALSEVFGWEETPRPAPEANPVPGAKDLHALAVNLRYHAINPDIPRRPAHVMQQAANALSAMLLSDHQPVADELRNPLAELAAELSGVIVHCEEGEGFDTACLETIKRVRDTLNRIRANEGDQHV